jgi:2-keto-4-pentenoate hydratase/2-oxohepta-3-ene-1,7-dioic acid hydratase in catechol pathway
MKICRYNDGSTGLIEADRVYPLEPSLVELGAVKVGASAHVQIAALHDPVTAQKAKALALKAPSIALSEVHMLVPLDNPPAIWAAAANYKAHQAEMIGRVGSSDRSHLTADELMAEIFLKPNSSLVGPSGTVILPKISKHVDFECELCAVIGKTAKNVSEENALDYVYGYTMCWDISIRDPWGIGRQNTRNIRKGFDTFCGVGPWIVSREEIAEPQALLIDVEQNGVNVMKANTADMINGLRPLIRFLSSVSTLSPGTLITTGTPAGVSRLADGDHLRGTITGIGVMDLFVKAEQ